MRNYMILLGLTALCLATAVANTRGKVVAVISGDTFWLDDSMMVRMGGMQAIEPPVQWGPPDYPWTAAKVHLSSMILGKEVSLTTEDLRSSGCELVWVFLDTVNINLKTVAEGFAMADLRCPFEEQGQFLEAEIAARRSRIGLWSKWPVAGRYGVEERPKWRVDTDSWQTYRDDKYGFEFRCPADAKINEQKGDSPEFDRSVGVRFPRIPTLYWQPGLWVTVRDSTQEERHRASLFCGACDSVGYRLYREWLAHRETVNLGGQPFLRLLFTEGAAGSTYYTWCYSTVGGNLYFDFQYERQYTGDPLDVNWYPPTPEDREAAIGRFDLMQAIISTFRFVK
jgi:endonuclease YncB( thermonuclease family)